MQNKTLMNEVAVPTIKTFVARKSFSLVVDFSTTGTLEFSAVSPSGREIAKQTIIASTVIGRQYGAGTKYKVNLTAVGGTATVQLNQL